MCQHEVRNHKKNSFNINICNTILIFKIPIKVYILYMCLHNEVDVYTHVECEFTLSQVKGRTFLFDHFAKVYYSFFFE